MEAKNGRIKPPEIEQINEMVDKLIGGYSLMSKAFMMRELAELKERIDKAGAKFGELKRQVDDLSNRPDLEMVKQMIEAAKIELRGEKCTTE